MTKKKKTKQTLVKECDCEFIYELSTPKGDWYCCIHCGARVHERDLIKK